MSAGSASCRRVIGDVRNGRSGQGRSGDSNAFFCVCLIFVFAIIAAGCSSSTERPLPARTCDSGIIEKVRQPASKVDPSVVVNCDLSLPIGFPVITKRLIVQGGAGSMPAALKRNG